MTLRSIWIIFRTTISAWINDKASRMGAALAFYSIFSLAPLMLFAIALGNLVFAQDQAQAAIVNEIRDTMGDLPADAIQSIVVNNAGLNRGVWAGITGVITLVVGAMGVFSELQDALNTIWQVQGPVSESWFQTIRRKIGGFTIVLGTGFILLVSLIASALLTAFSGWLVNTLGGGAVLWQTVNALISFVVIATLFALIFKWLPAVQQRWRDVWIGSLTTTALFTAGKFVLASFLGRGKAMSGFGASASVVLILLWVYYSALILLFGAELTRVLTLNRDHAEDSNVISNDRASSNLKLAPVQETRPSTKSA